MRRGISTSFVLGLTVLASSAWAHHNNIQFDPEKRVILSGTLSKLDWKNPHVYLFMEVKGDRDQVETWSFECQPPNFFTSRKIGKADFEKEVGHKVTAEFNPARDGSLNGVLWKMTFADGKVVIAKGGG